MHIYRNRYPESGIVKELQCEHCQHTQDADPHENWHFWNRVHLPAIECAACGKARGDA